MGGRPVPPPSLTPAEQDAFEKGVAEFNRGHFYECHDTLEDLWAGVRGPSRDFLQGLIQVAVGFYHLGNENPVGARRLFARALQRLEGYPGDYAGVDVAALRSCVVGWQGRLSPEGAPGPSAPPAPRLQLLCQGHDRHGGIASSANICYRPDGVWPRVRPPSRALRGPRDALPPTRHEEPAGTMTTHFEESLERDIDRIKGEVREMSAIAERSLRDCARAFVENDRQLAFAVILRDQHIDEKEKAIDQLCLEFLVRQQPVGAHLRFAYSTIKINLELERVGDYAESVARQVVKLGKFPPAPDPLKQWITEMADRSIPMLHDAVEAFVTQDVEAAQAAMEAEPAVDALKRKFNAEVVDLVREGKIPPEGIAPLQTIGRRFERVADQARNVCMEVLYLCTGELAKHPDAETIRILFVDEHNSCRSLIAEAIANSLDRPGFAFASAGLEPDTIDERTLQLLKEKGLDVTHLAPKYVYQVPDLDKFQVTVGLAERVKEAFPRTPRKMVYVDWSLDDPSQVEGSPEEVHAAYEAAFEYLSSHILELIEAVLGDRSE
jgi:phosphate transport system protein